VNLRISWSLTNLQTASQHGTELVQAPASAPCAGELPAAMSRALGMVADRVAAVIVAD
jgi:hypothetical protein